MTDVREEAGEVLFAAEDRLAEGYAADAAEVMLDIRADLHARAQRAVILD